MLACTASGVLVFLYQTCIVRVHYHRTVGRQHRYLRIVDDLRGRVATGEIAGGGLLPSESELAATYGVSRVTVRRALTELKKNGLIDSRQGFGWYVVGSPLRQSIQDLTTIERQIRAAGRTPGRELVRFAFVPTPPDLAEVLATDTVLEVGRLDRVDGRPFAIATVWVRSDLALGLSPRALEQRPLSDQLGVELGGAVQTIGAVAATAREAEALGVPRGAPLLRIERTTSAADGTPVLRSVALYNPLMAELVAHLPPVPEDGAPGLRLVAGESS
jgi:GntR family transcriptional regulator